MSKKIYFLIFLFINLFQVGMAQTARVDSLLRVAGQSGEDSTKAQIFLEVGLELLGHDIQSAIHYLDEAINSAKKSESKDKIGNIYNAKGRANAMMGDFHEAIINFQEALKVYQEVHNSTGEANVLSNLGSIYFMLGNSTKALELHFQSLKISEELGNQLRIGTSLNNIGTVYQKNSSTIDQALSFFKKSLEVFEGINEQSGMATAGMNIGEVYYMESQYDSAIYFHQLALNLCDGTIDAAFPLTQLGEINGALGNFQKAFNFHKRALDISEKLDAKFELTQALIGLAKTLRIQQDYAGAISTLMRANVIAAEIEAKNELMESYSILSGIFAQTGDYKAAYENEINAKSVKEDIAKTSTEQMIQQLQFEFELDKKEAEIELLQKDTDLKNAAVYNQRIIIFASFGGLLMFLIISISLFRNNISKQKANHLLQVQKEEIYAQREKVELAYDQLKSTQAQLIQSEKMASLGELTSGIAHEIQNPLNFVNNFSEVSAELMLELKNELTKGAGERDIALEEEIIRDVVQNLAKIAHHGKRADAIVKGMLEHSKRGSGQKQETDINSLAEDFLRMTYRSYITKNKDCGIEINSVLDSNLPKSFIVPQDIGKVFHNLFNNSFYACCLKKNSLHGDSNYKPQVSLNTAFIEKFSDDRNDPGRWIKITVSDNGPGIPRSIQNKIFQPFFTTKPSGEGTGLGLSLSYDIIKAHGGDLIVDSSAETGCAFTIFLPAT
jgi:two-component system, NtrC family, sensor kinase